MRCSCKSPLLAVFTALLFAAHSLPVAARQIAFTVGIDKYDNLPAQAQLQRAATDARAVAKAFRDIKYDEVISGENLSRTEFYALWQKLLNTAKADDTVAVYFSGHGIEIDGRNYLIPRDFPPMVFGREERAKRESISVSDLIYDLRPPGGRDGLRARLLLVILDACRDHPLVPPGQKSVAAGGGLASIEPPEGTFIMYAAGAGQTALDRLPAGDADPNSVYTRKLIPLLKTRGLPIAELARELRSEVSTLASSVPHVQVPAYYDNVVNRYCVAGCEDRSVAASASTQPAPAPVKVPSPQSAASTAKEALETQGSQIAALPPAPAVPPPPAADSTAQARAIQEGLKRAGCFDAASTGTWGKKTKAAVAAFNQRSDEKISADGPTPEAVALLEKIDRTICTPDCAADQIEKDGSCIARECPEGTERDKDGKECQSLLDLAEPLGAPYRTLLGHSKDVLSLALSRDGTTLVSGSADRTVKIWDMQSGELKRTIEGHDWNVSAVAISRNKEIIAAGCSNYVYVWSALTGENLWKSDRLDSVVDSIAISPDGELIFAPSGGVIHALDARTGSIVRTFEGGHTHTVSSIALPLNGKFLVSSQMEWEQKPGIAVIWDLSTGERLRSVEGVTGYSGFALSADGKIMAGGHAGGYSGGKIEVFETSGQHLRSLKTDDTGTSLAFSADGGLLAVGPGRLRVWDTRSGRIVFAEGDPSWRKALTLSPDGSTLISAGGPAINVWKLRLQ